MIIIVYNFVLIIKKIVAPKSHANNTNDDTSVVRHATNTGDLMAYI